MKLGKIEKWFINREKHSKKVIEKAEGLLNLIDIKSGQNYLEIGCGSGAVARYVFKKYKLNVTGTDIDKDQILLARRDSTHIKNITFLEADATNLPFKDKSFDIVLSVNVLHHISNWMDALKEINRVLRSNGYFILEDLFFPEWTKKFGKILARRAYGITTIDSMDLFIAANNYSILHSRVIKSLMWNNLRAIYKKR